VEGERGTDAGAGGEKLGCGSCAPWAEKKKKKGGGGKDLVLRAEFNEREEEKINLFCFF